MSESTISRRAALQTLGAAGAATLLGGGTGVLEAAAAPRPGRPASKRPNILFVMTDDHAVAALSCYGSRMIDTPNLDRLASQGMRFTNCFVTNALCSPSRAVALTGKFSHQNGLLTNTDAKRPPFDGTQQTFPKLLQQAGYTTAIAGKWHLKSDPTGFDYWNILPGHGRYRNPQFIEMGEERQYDGYVTDVITDLSIQTMERLKGEDKPFCLFSWHKAPHRGWIPDQKHEQLYEDADIPVPPTFNDDYFGRASAAAEADMRIADMPDWRRQQPEGMTEQQRKHWNYQRYIKNYLRTLVSFDENVGRLMDYLDRSGLAENTLVVYTSDNGFFLGEHGWYDKRFMYEESLRVPLIVRLPGAVQPGSTDDHMVQNLDFAQTFLDYAGAPDPGDMQGRSLRPVLEGRAPADWRNSVYYHYYEYPGPHKVHPHYGVRTDRYKLIHYYPIGEWELFDLEKDPYELNNVVSAPAYVEVVRELKAELDRVRRHYRDETGKPVAD